MHECPACHTRIDGNLEIQEVIICCCGAYWTLAELMLGQLMGFIYPREIW